MDDDIATAVFGFFIALFALAMVVNVAVWVFAHTWPYLLAAGLLALAIFICHLVRKKKSQSEAYRRRQIDSARARAEHELETAFNETIAGMRNLRQGHS